MTTEDQFEPAAVPANDRAPYLVEGGVSDEEFDEWVKRSQADTDAAIAEWDASVSFERRWEPDPAPMELDDDGDLIEAEIVEEEELEDPPPPDRRGPPWWVSSWVSPPGPAPAWVSSMMDRILSAPQEPIRLMVNQPRRHGRAYAVRRLEELQEHIFVTAMHDVRALQATRRNMEAQGFVVVDREATVTLPRSALHPMEHRFGYFVSDYDVAAATGGRLAPGIELPNAADVEWARRTFRV